jgi:alpha-beta hydrolase superfamily lysophospholipase
VHGICHAAWCWQENFLPYFANAGYSSYALSLRGHGKSKNLKPLQKLSLDDYVSDVADAVNLIGSPAVLIGHSMGGMVVQKYLEVHSAPAAVLLASVPPGGILPSTLRFALKRPFAFLRINIKRSVLPLIETPELCKQFLFSDDMPDAKTDKYFSRMQDESFRAMLDMMGLSLPHPQKVNSPMLILGAENDAFVSRREYEQTGRAYGFTPEIFPEMGHDMMLDTGWRKTADRILECLDNFNL